MNVFDKYHRKLRANNKELKVQVQTFEKRVTEYKKVQELLVKDILTLNEVESTYKGNDYTTYLEAVTAVSEKYNGTADWGCIQTGTIIDLRAAFILGEGIEIVHKTETRKEAEKELQWAEDFFAWNDLDAEMAQEMAKEAEIEGKVAIKLFYDDKPYREWPGMVSARYISWTSKKYEITTDPQDYLVYKKLTWKPADKSKDEVLEEPIFVYKKFGGRINAPNEAQSKIMKCLTQIDRLDKALKDLRIINHLYSAPTPDFEVEDSNQVEALLAQIKNINWKIGKAIVHTGHFELKGVDASGIANLIGEIEINVKMISGTTGVPIHFLGLLDLLKNRATGDNTRELVMAATARERKIWRGVYEELVTKAMNLFNEKVNEQKSKESKLKPDNISINIPLITQEHWDRIERVLIPAHLAGIVSKEHVASQIPGVDSEKEAELTAEKEKKEEESAKKELENIKNNPFGQGNKFDPDNKKT